MPFAIGIDHPKKELNVGTLMRSAFNLGASMVFTVGRRYHPQASDTVHAWMHVPTLNFVSWDDYRAHAPMEWTPVGVEIAEQAVDLRTFDHPRSAVYVLGAEDRGLSQEALDVCRAVVSIPSRLCLNVAVAGAIVMYDRAAKKDAHMAVRRPARLP